MGVTPTAPPHTRILGSFVIGLSLFICENGKGNTYMSRTRRDHHAIGGSASEGPSPISPDTDLRAVEARYRSLFAAIPIPIWVHDAGTLAFLEVNKSCVERYGYSRDEFLSMAIG